MYISYFVCSLDAVSLTDQAVSEPTTGIGPHLQQWFCYARVSSPIFSSRRQISQQRQTCHRFFLPTLAAWHLDVPSDRPTPLLPVILNRSAWRFKHGAGANPGHVATVQIRDNYQHRVDGIGLLASALVLLVCCWRFGCDCCTNMVVGDIQIRKFAVCYAVGGRAVGFVSNADKKPDRQTWQNEV